MGPAFLAVFIFGLGIAEARAACDPGCLEVLKSVNSASIDGTELSTTLTNLSKRYEQIYSELGMGTMNPKLLKLTTRALVAIDLKSAGLELNPEPVLHLRNLFSRFKGQTALENLSASYIGNLVRGDLEEARREAGVILAHLKPDEIKTAHLTFGVHSEASPVWGTLSREHPAVFERIQVKDPGGKSHELFVLLGHPDNATSTLQRFHQILRDRYGSELYINDDLVPSALGFYQGVPEDGKGGPPYIILRTENLKQDFLDFVGYHEGRHVMFKSARKRMKSVAPVEVQIRAREGGELPSWYDKELNVPTPENETARIRHAREKNSYKRFMTFEENYTHVKDLKYASRLQSRMVLGLFDSNPLLPPHRLFDLQMIREKIDFLNEITFKTKHTALESRLWFEKQVKDFIRDIARARGVFAPLEGLKRESFEFQVNGDYFMKIDFSTNLDRNLSQGLLARYRRFQRTRAPGARKDADVTARAEQEFAESLLRFQEALSARLIESHDFALAIKIRLSKLSDRFESISKKTGITRDEYLEFRKELFNQGRSARQSLFKEEGPSTPASPPGP